MEISAPSEWAILSPRYKFLEYKANGSFGTVYKARDTETGKLVAVKYMKDIFRHNYSAVRVFRELEVHS